MGCVTLNITDPKLAVLNQYGQLCAVIIYCDDQDHVVVDGVAQHSIRDTAFCIDLAKFD